MSFYHSFEQYIQSIADGKVPEISLSHRGLDNDSCRALAGALLKTNAVRVIDLQSNHIGSVGVELLCNALKNNSSVVEINLEQNEIDDVGIDALVALMAHNSSIVAVHVAANKTTDPKKMEKLHYAVSLNTQPQQVKNIIPRLYDNDPAVVAVDLAGIDGISFPLLCNALSLNKLARELNCSATAVGDVGCEHFAKLFQSASGLELVDLSANGITLHGVRTLAEGLKVNKTIHHLVLSNNKLADEAGRVLVELLEHNDALVEIDTADNAISSATFDSIAHGLDLNRQPIELKRAYYAARTDDPRLERIEFAWIPNMSHAARFLWPVLRNNTTVKVLNLSNARIGDVGAGHIATIVRQNKVLVTLELANNDISSSGASNIATALAENPLSSLTEINLANNRVCDIAAAELAHALLSNSTVTFLNLELNDVSAKLMNEISGLVTINAQPRALKAVLPQVEANSELITMVDFSQYDGSRYYTDESARVLCRALATNTFVVSVDLSSNSIGDAGAQHFAELLDHTMCLEILNLGNCAIGDRGALAIADALYRNQSLTELDLSANGISETSGEAFLDMLKSNHFLASLNVERTRIGAALSNDLKIACSVNTQPQSLKKAIPRLRADDPTLVELNLSVFDGHRHYNDAAVAILCHEMMTNDRITHLDLSCNRFGPDGAVAIGELLQQPHCRLEYLSVAGNLIGPDGAKALAYAFERNGSLKTVDLRDTGLGSQGVFAVARSLEKNDTIRSLLISEDDKDISPAAVAELTRQLAINSQSLTLKTMLPLIIHNDPSATTVTMIGDGDGSLFGDVSANLLALALAKNTTVTSVDLRCNDISSEGAEYFADMLEDNTAIVEFNLAHNRITESGAQALIRVIAANHTLRRLDLSGNPLSQQTLNELEYVMRVNSGPLSLKKVMVAIAMNAPEVTDLDFTGADDAVPMTDDALHILCSLMVSNTHVLSVKMANNEITDEGAQLIADMLRVNRTLAYLTLDNNRITTEGAHAIFLALKVNHTLCDVSFAGNQVSRDIIEEIHAQLVINSQPLKDPKPLDHAGDVPSGANVHLIDDNTLFRDHDYMRECLIRIFRDAMVDFHSPPKRVPIRATDIPEQQPPMIQSR